MEPVFASATGAAPQPPPPAPVAPAPPSRPGGGFGPSGSGSTAAANGSYTGVHAVPTFGRTEDAERAGGKRVEFAAGSSYRVWEDPVGEEDKRPSYLIETDDVDSGGQLVAPPVLGEGAHGFREW